MCKFYVNEHIVCKVLMQKVVNFDLEYFEHLCINFHQKIKNVPNFPVDRFSLTALQA